MLKEIYNINFDFFLGGGGGVGCSFKVEYEFVGELFPRYKLHVRDLFNGMGDFIHVYIKIFNTNLLIYERPNTLLADLRRVEPPPPPPAVPFFKFMRVKERRGTDHRALCMQFRSFLHSICCC